MGGEQTFLAHRVVLAAESSVFRDGLNSTGPTGGRQEVRLADIVNPEAVQFMLHYLYQMEALEADVLNLRTVDVTKDLLRLAQNFSLPGLTERAIRWLAKDLTTGNVVERLSICDEFGLTTLHEKIIEQLTLNRKALAEVAGSPQIMQHPKLMQALLQQAASIGDEQEPQEKTPPPAKKAKKA